MSESVIDLKINTAFKQSKELYKRELSWQEKVDTLLDRMNELNRLLNGLHSVILKLSFELERDMDGFKKSKIAPATIRKLVALTAKILNKVFKSDLYPGVKTTYYTLKQEISYLNELTNDRKVSIELDNDDEMKAIIQSTLAGNSSK